MRPPANAAEVEVALESLVPDAAAVVWGAGVAGAVEPPLEPEEAASVRDAVPSRRLEFARGRACARAALRAVGLAGRIVLPAGPDRAPAWPPGHTGSITHGADLVAAVATRVDTLRAVGIDVELLRPLPEGTHPLVLTSEERADPDAPPDICYFSAKEAVFKALHPLTGVWLDFLDVTLRFDARREAFRAFPAYGASKRASGLPDLRGRVRVVGGVVLAAAWMPARTPTRPGARARRTGTGAGA